MKIKISFETEIPNDVGDTYIAAWINYNLMGNWSPLSGFHTLTDIKNNPLSGRGFDARGITAEKI